MRESISQIVFALPLVAGVLMLGGCDDPTVTEDHIDVDGFELLFEDGGETYEFQHAVHGSDAPVLALSQGVHEVVFRPLDHDGDPLAEEGHEEEEHVLEITILDPQVLTWTPEGHVHGGAFVEFHGELDALQAGSTTMSVCVPHGAHCDFQVDVPVTVSAQ